MNILNPHAKLLWHGDRVGDWLKGKKSSPVLIEIAPTGYCNANCPWCFFNAPKGTKKIKTQTMLKALEDMSLVGLKAINWTGGGEPSLHPDFGKFVDKAHSLGIKQGIFSNGYLKIPQQEKFEWIRISLTDKGFKPIKKPKAQFGICLNHIPEHSKKYIESMCQKAKKFGAAYFQIRPALAGHFKTQPKLDCPEYLKKYETKNFRVYVTPYKYFESVRGREYNKCYGFNFCPSIDWNGRLGACLYMMGGNGFSFGDLNEKSFADIWGKIPNFIKVSEKCQNCCKNHEINKILFQSKNVKQIEFL
jgi:organic radical activating enzyme